MISLWLYLRWCMRKVYSTSIPFRHLMELNSHYKFYEIQQFYEVDDIKSDIILNRAWYENLVFMCRENELMVNDYIERLSEIELRSERSLVRGIPNSLYKSLELKLVNSHVFAPICWLTVKSGDRLYTQDEIESMLSCR